MSPVVPAAALPGVSSLARQARPILGGAVLAAEHWVPPGQRDEQQADHEGGDQREQRAVLVHARQYSERILPRASVSRTPVRRVAV